MKLMYLLLISLFTTTFSSAIAQNIKVKKNQVFVDGQLFLNIKTQTIGSRYLFRLPSDPKQMIKVAYLTFNNPHRVSNSNPEGRVGLGEMRFLGTDYVAKLECSWEKDKKGITRIVLDYGLVRDGKLNMEAVHDFAMLSENKYREEGVWIQGIDIP